MSKQIEDGEGTFSMVVYLHDTQPVLEVSVDETACWFAARLYSEDYTRVASVTIHLPDNPESLRAMADDLRAAADRIEMGHQTTTTVMATLNAK